MVFSFSAFLMLNSMKIKVLFLILLFQLVNSNASNDSGGSALEPGPNNKAFDLDQINKLTSDFYRYLNEQEAMRTAEIAKTTTKTTPTTTTTTTTTRTTTQLAHVDVDAVWKVLLDSKWNQKSSSSQHPTTTMKATNQPESLPVQTSSNVVDHENQLAAILSNMVLQQPQQQQPGQNFNHTNVMSSVTDTLVQSLSVLKTGDIGLTTGPVMSIVVFLVLYMGIARLKETADHFLHFFLRSK